MSEKNGPWYGCDCNYCSSEISYPASDLVVDKDGNVWCEGCLDSEVSYDEREAMELVAFVPESDKTIATLQAELQRITGIVEAHNARRTCSCEDFEEGHGHHWACDERHRIELGE